MSAQASDDAHCMRRLGEGDDLALNDLMGRWKEPLIAFCLRYTGNVADAQEIAQETFVKVYGSRHRYRPTAAFSTWLFTIATNLCRTRSRWRSRHPEVLECDLAAEAKKAADRRRAPADPATETDHSFLATDLEAAISSLPHAMRAAFILFEIDGLSYEEISNVLRCSRKTVERRLAHAREHLRATLEPRWGGF
jgi:RNA polymerase sigma-70 factor (ECF subfamily)